MLSRPRCFRGNEFKIEGDCDPACDLVLKREEIGGYAIEPLSPQMCFRLSVNQLGVDPHQVARAADAAFQHITHTELEADLPRRDRFVPVCERGTTRDHEHACDP